MICPILNRECHKVDCAWFRDGECVISSFPELVEKLEDVTDALQDVKHGINGIATEM